MKNRDYFKINGSVAYRVKRNKGPDGYATNFFQCFPLDEAAVDRNIAEREIHKFERKEAEIAQNRALQNEKETKLLELCGLGHDDFVRFRGVYRDGEILHVETRENGVGARSSDAIKNPNYLRSYPDQFDTTYEYFEFQIPESA